MRQLSIISVSKDVIFVQVFDRIIQRRLALQEMSKGDTLNCDVMTENGNGNVDIYVGDDQDNLKREYVDYWVYNNDPVEVPIRSKGGRHFVDPQPSAECELIPGPPPAGDGT